jgi:DNA invertase Pin-like site-specific DNA recombinase
MRALLSFLDAQPDQKFVVIVDYLNRFARATRFHLDLREAFRKRGATIECLNFKLDDTPEGEFIETIMAAQGALERKQNGRQVAQKMKPVCSQVTGCTTLLLAIATKPRKGTANY